METAIDIRDDFERLKKKIEQKDLRLYKYIYLGDTVQVSSSYHLTPFGVGGRVLSRLGERTITDADVLDIPDLH